MARTRSGPLGGRPKTLRKACWYSGKAAIWAAAASRLGCPISLGLAMGSAACSSSVFTRPSQNCVLLWSAFRTVGELRWPTRPLTPIETGLPSVKARAGSWQILQATVPSIDRRPSKKSFRPRATFSRVCGLSAGTAARVASTGTPTCLRDLGSANGPAAGIGGGFAGVCADAFAAAPNCQLVSFATQPARVSAANPIKSVVQNRIRFPTRIRMTTHLPAFPGLSLSRIKDWILLPVNITEVDKDSVLNAHNIRGNPIHRSTETTKSPVHDHEVSLSHARSRFVLKRWWDALERLNRPSRPGAYMSAVLNVVRRPETLSGCIVTLLEQRVEGF